MSGFALKIVAVCPESLLDATFVGYFGRRTGVFVANLKNELANAENGWLGEKFDELKKTQYLDIIDLLDRREALIEYDPTSNPPPPAKSTSYNLVVREFKNGENRTLDFAVCDNEKAAPDLRAYFFPKMQAILDNMLHNSGHLRVDMQASALSETLTKHVFKCHKFKIIDPYIFNIKDKGNRPRRMQRRMDFLVELINQVKIHNEDPEKVDIEVIGRSYNKDGDARNKIDESDLRDLLSQDVRVCELAKNFNIQFIGLDDEISDEDLHLRCLYTEKYVVSIEHSFESRFSKSQKVWYGSEYSHSEITRIYHDDSSEFEPAFSFWADEIAYDH